MSKEVLRLLKISVFVVSLAAAGFCISWLIPHNLIGFFLGFLILTGGFLSLRLASAEMTLTERTFWENCLCGVMMITAFIVAPLIARYCSLAATS